MGLADRKFNWEIQSAGLTGTDMTMDLRRTFTSIEIAISAETMESRAAMDPADDIAKWAAPRIKRRTVNVDCRGVVGDADGDSEDNMFEAWFVGNETGDDGLVFSLQGSDGPSNTAITVTVPCRVESGNFNNPGEASEMGITLIGVGPPTVEVA